MSCIGFSGVGFAAGPEGVWLLMGKGMTRVAARRARSAGRSGNRRGTRTDTLSVREDSPALGQERRQPAAGPADGAPMDRADAADARDLALVEAIRSGDQRAWNELLESYQDRLYTLCLRMVSDPDLAADLTQDTMVRVIRGLDSFNAESRLSTWIYRIAMNICLSRLRAEKLRRHPSLDEADSRGQARSSKILENREPRASLRIQQSERRRLLGDALDRLDPDHRAILVLRDVRGLEYDAIALVLGVAMGTVKSRLFRARVALRRAIQELSGDVGSSEGVDEQGPSGTQDATPDSTRRTGTQP
ncbi:MAG: sigma-70 family RNA polymerase sigma factor [Phycisphaerales bacterium]|nr:MAG: sigma-70 family RNA polymerase sigma factor [Phycisphaerales bacterium]